MTDTPDRIVTNAERLYLSGGLGAVTMRNVADQVGITATALYRHFSDRDDLIDALAERGFALFLKYLTKPRRGDPLRTIWNNYLDFALDHPRVYALIFLEQRRRPRRYPDDFARHASASFDALHDVVRREMQAGRLARDNSLEVALGFWAHVHGLVVLQLAGRFADVPTFRRVAQRALGRVLKGLGPQPPARARPASSGKRIAKEKR